METETLGMRVRSAMRREGLNGKKLAQLLGKEESFVSKLGRDLMKVTPEPQVFEGLERILGIPQWWALKALGYGIEDAQHGTGSIYLLPDIDETARAVQEKLAQMSRSDRLMYVMIADTIIAARDEEQLEHPVQEDGSE